MKTFASLAHNKVRKRRKQNLLTPVHHLVPTRTVLFGNFILQNSDTQLEQTQNEHVYTQKSIGISLGVRVD